MSPLLPDETSPPLMMTGVLPPTRSSNFTDNEAVDIDAADLFTWNQRLLFGVILSITGNLFISISMNVQKHAHNLLIESGTSYTKSKMWWIGIVLMVGGEIGNFAAYGFAPASMVAPLGTTTVIANAVIAVVFLKEQIRPRDILGIVMAIVGAFLLINFSTQSDTMLTAKEIVRNLGQPPFIAYLIIEIVAFIGVLYVNKRYEIPRYKIITILLQVAILGSLTVISAKAVSSMLTITFRGLIQLNSIIFYVMLLIMVVTAVGQVRFLNQAMQLYDATVVVPTNFVMFTVSAILSGVVFYQEFYGMSFLQIVMFLFGAMLSFVGVFFITGGRKKAEEDTEKEVTAIPHDHQRVEDTGPDLNGFTVNSDTTPLLSQTGYISTDFTPPIGTKEAWRVQPPSNDVNLLDNSLGD